MSDPVHPLTLWLARASVAFYAAAVLIAVSNRDTTEHNLRLWRIFWSAACLVLVIHVLAAFHFEHGWSHSSALKHTADQTARVTGIHWGGGLYFNYAFLLLWILDVAGLWVTPRKRQTILRQTTDIACVFMVFNATAVFGPRWWIIPVVIVGLLAFYYRQTGNIQTAEDQSLDDARSR